MAASNLTSTHPPLSERIRILRSMAGGASLADYDQSYQQVHKGGRGVLPAPALAATGAVGLRAVTPEAVQEEPSKVERVRETSDLMWRGSDYKTITCDCGTRLRVPPKFKASSVRCPHCGRTHRL
jgi:heat shock protein HtpX